MFKRLGELSLDMMGPTDQLGISTYDYNELLREAANMFPIQPMKLNTVETFAGKIQVVCCPWLGENEYMILDAEAFQREMESHAYGYGFLERKRLVDDMKKNLDRKLLLGE